MDQLGTVLKTVSTMPGETLALIVVLAGFGLAAFAIYAVWSVVKERT